MRERLLKLREELESVAATSIESAAATGERRHAMLRNIEAALRRIESGDYGLCQDCDEPIDPKRLEFDPTALRCIGCASQAEK